MTINYYRHHLGDYAKDTAGLTMLEHGAYRLLLDFYYSRGQALPNDISLIYRACQAHNPRERGAVDKMLSKFFHAVDGTWLHERCEKELLSIRNISEVRKKAASNCSANAKQLLPSHKPVANSHKIAASKNGFHDEICTEEILPSSWHTLAEQKGIPDERIYQTWGRFKDHTSQPYRLKNWAGWLARERVN